MLCLKRFINEVVMIGDEIKIIVTETGPGWAKLSFEAPRDVPIHRKEVYEAIQREKQQAVVQSDGEALSGVE